MNMVLDDRDTVAVDGEVHAIYKQLTEGIDPVGVPFRTMKDVFMWAVILGYQKGGRKPLTSKRVTVFRWAQLSPQVDIPLLKAISIAETADVEVLESQGAILGIAEEYANTGIFELSGLLQLDSGHPLWNLVSQLRNSGG